MTAGTGGWVHAEEGEAGVAAVLPLSGGVDGQRTRTHEAQGLGRDAFRCDFIAGLLSHSHSNETKEQKNKKRWDENIATVRKWKMREGKSKERNESEWQILSTGYRRQGGFIWIMHDLKHRKLAEWKIWQNVHPQMESGLLMGAPNLQRAMWPAATQVFSSPSFFEQSKSGWSSQSIQTQFTLS